jgi:hypothetical protein
MGSPGSPGVGPWIVQTLRRAGWAPAAVFAAHVVASKGFDAYRHVPHFDVPMHLLGGVAIAYFFHAGSRLGSAAGVLAPYHRLTHGLLVFGLTCATAVFWEFAEFLADRYLGTNMQGGDLNDTLLDLLLGMCGGLALLAAAWACGRLPAGERA